MDKSQQNPDPEPDVDEPKDESLVELVARLRFEDSPFGIACKLIREQRKSAAHLAVLAGKLFVEKQQEKAAAKEQVADAKEQAATYKSLSESRLAQIEQGKAAPDTPLGLRGWLTMAAAATKYELDYQVISRAAHRAGYPRIESKKIGSNVFVKAAEVQKLADDEGKAQELESLMDLHADSKPAEP